MGIRCCRRISGRPIPGYDLDVWKCCEPSADINGLPGGDQSDYPVALKIDHDRPIGESFAEREVIHTDLFDGSPSDMLNGHAWFLIRKMDMPVPFYRIVYEKQALYL